MDAAHRRTARQEAGLHRKKTARRCEKSPAGVKKWRGQEANEPPISRGTPMVTESSSADSSALPPDLALVVAAWDRLPEVVRAGILAMVKASGG
jgi:hypothetical protein